MMVDKSRLILQSYYNTVCSFIATLNKIEKMLREGFVEEAIRYIHSQRQVLEHAKLSLEQLSSRIFER